MTADENRLMQAEMNAFCEMLNEKYGCDAIQILVTYMQDGATHCKKLGAGNWYARKAMCGEFVNDAEDVNLAVEIGKRVDPPSDGEGWKS